MPDTPHLTELGVSLIRTDGGTQPRAQMDGQIVTEYAEDMAAGAEFPPVVVFYDGTWYWLADGYHRLAAARKAGKPSLTAAVHQGTRRDAVLFSVGANSKHGFRRSNTDKRRAVETILRDAEWGKWGDREIARQTNVSHTLVAQVRADLHLAELPDSRTVQRGDSSYSMKTGGIGQNPPAYAPVYTLERNVRTWLDRRFAEDDRAKTATLEQIKINSPAGRQQWQTLLLSGLLAEPYRQGDLRQAANNVLDQLRQLAARAEETPARPPAEKPEPPEQWANGLARAGQRGGNGNAPEPPAAKDPARAAVDGLPVLYQHGQAIVYDCGDHALLQVKTDRGPAWLRLDPGNGRWLAERLATVFRPVVGRQPVDVLGAIEDELAEKETPVL